MISNVKAYTEWLIQQNYSTHTIKRYTKNVIAYLAWINRKPFTLKQATYKDLINYIGYLQEHQKTRLIINEALRGIRKYYDFLQLPNIAYNVQIRGVQKYQLLFLTEEELNFIYENYTGYIKDSYTRHSNKLILGFMIYQATSKHDLQLIKLKDVDLEKGTLYIPSGSKRFNSRKVKLEAHQIIALHTYITEYRGKGVRAMQSDSELLFIPQADKFSRLSDQCKRMQKDIKKMVENTPINYQNLSQLRNSRMSLWIKQYGIRQAQYLSGRKKIASMERYQQMDLQDLSKQIEMFHPLG